MFPIDFIPVEMTGMSVVTAICLSFLITGFGIYMSWDKREHTRIHKYAQDGFVDINDKAGALFSKHDAMNRDLSDIKTHIAGMHEALDWIKKYMETKSK